MEMLLKVLSSFMTHPKGPGLGEGGFSQLRAFSHCFKDGKANRMPQLAKGRKQHPRKLQELVQSGRKMRLQREAEGLCEHSYTWEIPRLSLRT